MNTHLLIVPFSKGLFIPKKFEYKTIKRCFFSALFELSEIGVFKTN